jgi:hypothetical protein
MVAKITTPLSVERALNYNEQKVQKGKAECLFAGNFLYRAKEMNFYQKLHRFQQLLEGNTSKTNTLHISLNFHPSEVLAKEKLIQIAECYINKIGFAEQPFLVYQHHDAGHPHLHIVTTNIREDGKRIDTYNIGKNQSQKARKEIDEAYGLVKAAGRNETQRENIEAINAQRVKYGHAETKQSISNVLALVVAHYKFTSLAELNAVLKLYNVASDRGSEESRVYKNSGLNYRLLDENGNKIGVPIKASSIYFKPTLHFLEKKFEENHALRLPFKSKLKIAIDWTLRGKPKSIQDFILQLQKEKITTVLRQNEQGFLYGVTYIDHRTHCVFNGSNLGKEYSAAGIKKRIMSAGMEEKKSVPNLLEKSTDRFTSQEQGKDKNQKEKEKQSEHVFERNRLLNLLTGKEQNDYRIPFDLVKKKKKRRKPNL